MQVSVLLFVCLLVLLILVGGLSTYQEYKINKFKTKIKVLEAELKYKS